MSGKVSLNWTVNEHNFLYAFVATGFKPGGLNVDVGLGLPRAVQVREGDELRTRLEGRACSTAICARSSDAFYNDYDNFQVIIGYPLFPVFGFELNVPDTTTMYGVEAQAEAVFGALLAGRGSRLDAQRVGSVLGRRSANPRAIAFPRRATPATRPGDRAASVCHNLEGRDQTYAPEFTFNIGAQYVFELGDEDTLTPRINYGHVSPQWATLFENAGARRPDRGAQHHQRAARLDARRVDHDALRHQPDGPALCRRHQLRPALCRSAASVRPARGEGVLTPKLFGRRAVTSSRRSSFS